MTQKNVRARGKGQRARDTQGQEVRGKVHRDRGKGAKYTGAGGKGQSTQEQGKRGRVHRDRGQGTGDSIKGMMEQHQTASQ